MENRNRDLPNKKLKANHVAVKFGQETTKTVCANINYNKIGWALNDHCAATTFSTLHTRHQITNSVLQAISCKVDNHSSSWEIPPLL
jgi:hypothetical protein